MGAMTPRLRIALSGLVVGGVLSACEAPSVSSTPEQREQSGQAEQTRMARVGDTLRLSGNEEGLEMQVTLMNVVDPAKSGNAFIKPQKGKRFVGVKLELANVGERVYKDSPSNGAVVVDAKSQQYNATIAGVEPDLGTPTIAQGDKRVGFLTFEVP
jgi:hypothetical protein